MVYRKIIIIVIFYILDIIVLAIEFMSTIGIVLIVGIVSTKDTLIIFKSVVIMLIVEFMSAGVLFVNIKIK